MPLETATYISQLVATNPAGGDAASTADDHARLIKAAVKATFPNFTAAALSSTQAQIDTATAAVSASGGVSVLADAGAFFKTNTTDGITNPAAGEVDVKAGGNIVAKLKADLSATFLGTVTAASDIATLGGVAAVGAYVGGTGQLIPVGLPLMWLTDTAPTGFLFLNGQTVSRTTYAALFAVYGTYFGAGNGSTTFTLPDMREIAAVGKSTMGGVSARGLIGLANIGTIGAVVGEATHALTVGEMPSHNHGGATGTVGVTLSNFTGNAAAYVSGNTRIQLSGPNAGDQSAGPGTFGLTANGGTGSISSQGSGTAHNVVQPSFVVNYICKF